jgi:hypothetical protein
MPTNNIRSWCSKIVLPLSLSIQIQLIMQMVGPTTIFWENIFPEIGLALILFSAGQFFYWFWWAKVCRPIEIAKTEAISPTSKVCSVWSITSWLPLCHLSQISFQPQHPPPLLSTHFLKINKINLTSNLILNNLNLIEVKSDKLRVLIVIFRILVNLQSGHVKTQKQKVHIMRHIF